MDSAQHCLDQSAECRRMVQLAQSEAEAKTLLSRTWSEGPDWPIQRAHRHGETVLIVDDEKSRTRPARLGRRCEREVSAPPGSDVLTFVREPRKAATVSYHSIAVLELRPDQRIHNERAYHTTSDNIRVG
jgi:hypothetical protein